MNLIKVAEEVVETAMKTGINGSMCAARQPEGDSTMTQRTVTYNTDTHSIVPVAITQTMSMTYWENNHTSLQHCWNELLAADPDYPESEPEFTPEEVAMAEAPWSYVAPIQVEPINKRLLLALKLAKDMFIANDLSLPRTFEVMDEAIAAADQAYEPISDEEIAKAVRHLYASDTAAEMGLPDDLRTARAVLSLMEGK